MITVCSRARIVPPPAVGLTAEAHFTGSSELVPPSWPLSLQHGCFRQIQLRDLGCRSVVANLHPPFTDEIDESVQDA